MNTGSRDRVIRVGVLGAGRVFARLYLPALRRQAALELAGAADPAMPSISGVTVYPSEQDLIRAAPLDALVVLSPPALHAAHVAAGAAHGLHVLVEKPPALTTAEVDAWPPAGLVTVTPAFSRRFWDRYAGPKRPGAKWHFTLKTDPLQWGALRPEPVERDLLPHAADLAGWLSGERIAAVADVVRTGESVSGVFRLDGGGEFRWEVAHGPAYVEHLTLDGEPIGAPPGPIASLRGRLLRTPPQDVRGVERLLSEWAARLQGRPAPSLPTVADARACAAVIEAVERLPLHGPARP